MDHPATVRRLFDLINARDLDGFGALCSGGFVEHEELPGQEQTVEGVKAFFRMQIAAFPDMTMTPEDVIDGGEKVVVLGRFAGTHEGEFMGMPPTGRRVEVQFIDIMRCGDDGLVHEHWGVFDALGMMQQLGAVPG